MQLKYKQGTQFCLRSALNPHKVVQESQDGNIMSRHNCFLAQWNQKKNQIWFIRQIEPNNTYQIGSKAYPKYNFEFQFSSKGSQAFIIPYNPHDTQKWQFQYKQKGKYGDLYTIKCLSNNLYLSVAGQEQKIVANQFLDQDNFKWYINLYGVIQEVEKQPEQPEKKMLCSKLHFIFALDQSGSMSGGKWQTLMETLKKVFQHLRTLQDQGSEVLITIYRFNTSVAPNYLRRKLKQIRLSTLKHQGGQTRFGPPLLYARDSAKDIIGNFRTVLMFMTDGEGKYPSKEVKSIKELKNTYSEQFRYTGIQLISHTKAMTWFAQELHGQNYQVKKFQQLLDAYMNSIQSNIWE